MPRGKVLVNVGPLSLPASVLGRGVVLAYPSALAGGQVAEEGSLRAAQYVGPIVAEQSVAVPTRDVARILSRTIS